MSTLWQDLRFAVRTLRKRWMITSLAVLSLALAIGGNAAVFSMVDAFLFRPLPYPEPDRVVLVGDDMDGTLGEVETRLDPGDFLRVHRSHIVNLRHVESIRRYDERRLDIRLSDGSSVVASRQGSKALRAIMNQ